MKETKPKPKLKTVPATPDEAIHLLTEELTRIVRGRDTQGLDNWIKRYIRRISVGFPVPQAHEVPGMEPMKVAQMRVLGNVGLAISRGCVWSEQLDVNAAKKTVQAELYFLDVLGTMGLPEAPEGQPN